MPLQYATLFEKKTANKKPGVSVTLIYACLLLSGGGRIIILIWYFSLSLFPNVRVTFSFS